LHHEPHPHQLFARRLAHRAGRAICPTLATKGTLTFMRIVPYGSWASVISVDQLIGSSIGLSAVQIDGEHLYWLESRPDERGRTSLWRRSLSGGEPVEVTPPPGYVRDRVHEYGGGEYHVSGGTVVYSEFSDGRLYAIRGEGSPTRITQAPAKQPIPSLLLILTG
jgi:hypothetical protein